MPVIFWTASRRMLLCISFQVSFARGSFFSYANDFVHVITFNVITLISYCSFDLKKNCLLSISCSVYCFSIIYHLVIVNIISNTPRAIILSHRTCLVGHFCVYAWGLKPWFTITSRRRQGKNFWIARIIFADTKIGLTEKWLQNVQNSSSIDGVTTSLRSLEKLPSSNFIWSDLPHIHLRFRPIRSDGGSTTRDKCDKKIIDVAIRLIFTAVVSCLSITIATEIIIVTIRYN